MLTCVCDSLPQALSLTLWPRAGLTASLSLGVLPHLCNRDKNFLECCLGIKEKMMVMTMFLCQSTKEVFL